VHDARVAPWSAVQDQLAAQLPGALAAHRRVRAVLGGPLDAARDRRLTR